MALESQSTNIDGTTYKVTQLPYKKGQKLLLRLYKTLGPAFADGFSSVQVNPGKLGDTPVTEFLPSLAKVVKTLAHDVDEETFDYVVDVLAEHTEVNTGPDRWVPLASIIELHFAGKYWPMLQWLGFALKVNYSGFFDVRGALAGLVERVRQASPSPEKSTGTSTGLRVANATTQA